jgi:hypothetical protein
MEVLVAIVAVTAIGLAVLRLSAMRAITILEAEIENGELRVVRGGVAPRVLGDLRDIVVRPRVKAATLRIYRSGGRASVEAHGTLTSAQVQQIRNVVGIPLAKLTNAHRKR